MKKIILIILISFLGRDLIGQPITKRGGASVTVNDENLFTGKSFRVPVYTDTTAANLAVTLDSAGKLIFTYDINGLWLRESNPKKWVEVGSGGGGSGGGIISLGTTGAYGLILVNDSTYRVDTLVISTRAWRRKGDDSLGAIIATKVPILYPVGNFLSTTFPGSALPSDMTSSGATITVSGGKMQISGGDNTYSTFYARGTKATASLNWRDSMNFVINTIPSDVNGGIYIGRRSTASGTVADIYLTAKRLTSTTMCIVLKLKLSNTVFVTVDSSTTSVTMTAGDSYRMFLSSSNAFAFGKLQHIVGGVATEEVSLLYNYSGITSPVGTKLVASTGNPAIGVLGSGGIYDVEDFNEYHYDLQYSDVAIIGTSISTRYNAVSTSEHYIPLAFQNSGTSYAVLSGPGDKLIEMLTRVQEIRDIAPHYVLIEAGVNDDVADIRPNLTAFIDSIQTFSTPIVLQDFSVSTRDSIMFNVCKEQGVLLINVGKFLTSEDLQDGTHPNGNGFNKMANALKLNAPYIFSRPGSSEVTAFQDNKDVYFSGLTQNHVPTYDTVRKKFINQSIGSFGGSYIQNQSASPQSASFNIDAYGRIGTALGIGADPIAGIPIHMYENVNGGQGIHSFNNDAVSSSGTKYTQWGQFGSTGYSVPDWANAAVWLSYANGGTILGSYAGKIKFQTGSSFTTRGTWNSTGLSIGTTSDPSEALDVTGNVRFSGALMPNNAAGTAGNFLQSAGAGSPPIWTSTVAASSVPLNGITAATGSNTINHANNAQNWQWNSLTGGIGMWLSSSSTAKTGSATLFTSSVSGALSTGSISTYAASFSNTHTGTSLSNIAASFGASGGTINTAGLFAASASATTNIAGSFASTGATNNYAIIVPASSGSVGIGTSAPTALLHLGAGTATANTAPIKLNTGTALTTPEDGAIEYHGSHIYFTIGSTRYQLDQQVNADSVTTKWSTLGNTLTGTGKFGTLSNHGYNFITNDVVRGGFTSAGAFSTTQDVIFNGIYFGQGPVNGLSHIRIGDATTLRDITAGSLLNTGIGISALKQTTTGDFNLAVGYTALEKNTTGSDQNAFGRQAGQNNVGDRNLFLGGASGVNCLTCTYQIHVENSNGTGNGVATGRYNIILANSVANLSPSLHNSIVIADSVDIVIMKDSSGKMYINAPNTIIGSQGVGNSTLQSAGSFSAGYVAKTANYTATISDYTINCTANTFQVTLPTAVGCAGRIYVVTNSGAGTITVGTTSSQTFANVVATPTTLTMAAVGSRTVQSDGANWLLLSSL